MNKNYKKGFISKFAECGIDVEKLLKSAQGMPTPLQPGQPQPRPPLQPGQPPKRPSTTSQLEQPLAPPQPPTLTSATEVKQAPMLPNALNSASNVMGGGFSPTAQQPQTPNWGNINNQLNQVYPKS